MSALPSHAYEANDTTVAADRMGLVKIMERRTEVSGELDLRMMMFYGRDLFAESLRYGDAPPIPYRGGRW